jgi:ATP-dependent DNA ligase
VVRNRSWERDVFMCFDLLAVAGEGVVQNPLKQRLAALQNDILSKRASSNPRTQILEPSNP